MSDCSGNCCRELNVPSHPVQVQRIIHQSARCTKTVTLRAYEVYCEIFRPQDALVTGNCRGGFGVGELIALLYAHTFLKAEWNAKFHEALKGMSQF
jgi:hypothetical protein